MWSIIRIRWNLIVSNRNQTLDHKWNDGRKLSNIYSVNIDFEPHSQPKLKYKQEKTDNKTMGIFGANGVDKPNDQC